MKNVAYDFINELVTGANTFEFKRGAEELAKGTQLGILIVTGPGSLENLEKWIADLRVFLKERNPTIDIEVLGKTCLKLATKTPVVIHQAFTNYDVRGHTSIGAVIDSWYTLDADIQRALHNSQVTARHYGFPACSLVLPLGV